jgi:hypothetical protein
MNLKHIALGISLLLCNTITISATDHNATVKAIYAAKKAGELSHFAEDKYILLLELKNEELLAQKNNSKSIFHNDYCFATGATTSVVAMCTAIVPFLKAACLYAASASLEKEFKSRLYPRFSIQEGMPTTYEAIKTLKRDSFLQLILSGLIIKGSFTAFSYIVERSNEYAHDFNIDKMIEKNQEIIDQLKEIQNNI